MSDPDRDAEPIGAAARGWVRAAVTARLDGAHVNADALVQAVAASPAFAAEAIIELVDLVDFAAVHIGQLSAPELRDRARAGRPEATDPAVAREVARRWWGALAPRLAALEADT